MIMTVGRLCARSDGQLTWIYYFQHLCLGAYLLLHTDEVDHDGAKDEPVEKHDRLEASVPEEGGHHAKHEVEGAHGGGVGVVLPDNLDMLL